VLLHGLGANSSSWQLQMPDLLDRGFRPIAPDLPGFGKSRQSGGRWSIRYAAQAVASLLNHLQAAPLHVVGISMGGTVALQLALDYPRLVKKLVLVSTFARLWPESLGGWLYFAQRALLVWGRGLESQAQYVASRIFPGEGQQELRQALIEQIMQANPSVYKQAMRSLGLFNVQGRLGEIQAPTLVITGEADTTVPVHNQRPLVDKIPGARQIIFPDAGHALCVEQPERFNQVLLDFLYGHFPIEPSIRQERSQEAGR
jgi:pimeloyl-ACP methyl ester carboxylesterase